MSDAGTRIKSTVNLGAIQPFGSRFILTVPAGSVGVILADDSGVPPGWEAAQFDGYEQAEHAFLGHVDDLIVPVTPAYYEVV